MTSAQTMRVPHRLLRAAQFVTGLLGSILIAETEAGGFFIPQQSTQDLGRGFAGGAAMARDVSTVYTNPAGMTELDRAEVGLSVKLMLPTLEFDDKGSTATTPGTLNRPIAYPGNDGGDPIGANAFANLYAARPFMDGRLWGGIGVTAPFGLRVDYDDGWFGRYDSVETELITVDIAPTIAYRFNDRISVGGGIDVQYADAELNIAIPNTLAPGGPSPATDGLLDLEGDAWTVGFNLGVLAKPSATTRLGLHYRSGISHELEGSAAVTGLTGPLVASNGMFDARADLDLPAIVTLGIAQELTPKLTLLGQFQWFDWSTFKELRVRFPGGQPDFVIPENYDDSYAISVGAEYQKTPDWVVRAGFHYDKTPTVDGFRTTNVPDSDNYWLGVGTSYRVTKRTQLDFSYAHVRWETVRVDLTRPFFAGTPASGIVDIQGDAEDVHLNVLSLNLRRSF